LRRENPLSILFSWLVPRFAAAGGMKPPGRSHGKIPVFYFG
jgi:hypothetical protein